MGCNVSKDVKVENQGNADAQENAGGSMSEERAAEKIQASFRGYKARKSLKNNGIVPPQDQKSNKIKEEVNEKIAQVSKPDESVEDIDLDDPNVEKAALKIQSTFRGYKSRKGVNPDSADGKE